MLNACEQILARLQPIIAAAAAAAGPGSASSWEQIVNTAYFSRVNLSAQGWYIVPDSRCGYNWSLPPSDGAKRGTPFNYFTTGIACSEVEIDCLSGDCSVIRADVLMDVGQSINPAIDIGQIEGVCAHVT